MMDYKKYWDNRYLSGRSSGYGSYGEQLIKKLQWLSDLDIKSITEIGCGDFNFGKHLMEMYPNASYTGQDISSVIIEKNRAAYPKYEFTNKFFLPKADLLLCVDVLFHILPDDEYETMLNDLYEGWTDYLAVTTYERDEDPGTHVKIRKFDYKRFGAPLIREIVEEDGQLYFYLFKKTTIQDMHCPTGPQGTPGRRGFSLKDMTCCLNTKESVYPKEILDYITKLDFGEILIKTHSDSPSAKQELFRKAKHDLIYYQDDDAICPIDKLIMASDPDMMNIVMKPGHFEAYKDKKMTMGLGWGAIFPKRMLKVMDKYIEKYGEDEVYKREDTRILTHLNYPQNRLVLPVIDLPSATDSRRLYQQSEHIEFMKIAEERCNMLL